MTYAAELRQQLASAHTSAQAILAKAETDKRALDVTEQAAFDKASSDITSLVKSIEAAEKTADAKRLLDSQREERKEIATPQEKEIRATFSAYLMGGAESLTPEQRSIMREHYSPVHTEQRAQSVGTTTAGGYTVPTDFYANLVVAMKSFAGTMQAPCTVLTTDTGRTLPIPLIDPTATVAALLAENTAASDSDATFGQTSLTAYKYTTGIVKVSMELLQDTAIDIEGFLMSTFAERLGRLWNTHLTTGTGSSQPQGVVTGATLGKTTAALAAVTSDEILDLIHSVDPAYRSQPGFRLMFNDTTLKAILQLKDSQNRPLFQPSYRDAAPATIHGYQFIINQGIASQATGAKFMVAGDFKSYFIRMVRGLDIKRLVERYAEADQIAFVGFARMDAKLIDAGQNPIKYMKNA